MGSLGVPSILGNTLFMEFSFIAKRRAAAVSNSGQKLTFLLVI